MTDLIDLSHTIEDGMVTYPGLPGPVIGDFLTREDSRSHYAPGVEFHIGNIEMVANTGTYLDVPAHRFRDGFGLEDLALELVADLSGVVVASSRTEIGPEAIEGVEIGGRAVLFATGWSRHWGSEEYGSPGHPFLNGRATEALVAGGAALVGIDSVNIDDTRTGERPAHTGLLAAGIPIVEHLTNLERLGEQAFRFFAVPVKVVGLGTWPVRAFAITL